VSEEDTNSLIDDKEYIDLDKLSLILYKETMRLAGKLQKMSEKSKEYKQSLGYLTKLLSVLVHLMKVHKPIEEGEDLATFLMKLGEVNKDEMVSDGARKVVEETIKSARPVKRTRKTSKIVET
jgi:hypothetical protein